MCECIAKLENGIIEKWNPNRPRKILDASIVGITTVDKKRITTSSFEVKFEGLKNKETVVVQHNCCPFCGQQY